MTARSTLPRDASRPTDCGHQGLKPRYRPEGIVRHHPNRVEAVRQYDASPLDASVQKDRMGPNTASALAKLTADRSPDRSPLRDTSLTDAQMQHLTALSRTLVDPCVRDPACLAPWIPGPADSDPDDLRLVARFEGRAAP